MQHHAWAGHLSTTRSKHRPRLPTNGTELAVYAFRSGRCCLIISKRAKGVMGWFETTTRNNPRLRVGGRRLGMRGFGDGINRRHHTASILQYSRSLTDDLRGRWTETPEGLICGTMRTERLPARANNPVPIQCRRNASGCMFASS
jgi:hypothetical protein